MSGAAGGSAGDSLKGTPWLPVEANPEVFNAFAAKMGFPTSELVWQDVLSHEDWALEMLPTPVRACAMVYEIVPQQEAFRAAEEAARAAAPAPPALPFWMVQQIPNACGTLALLHAAVNAVQSGDVAAAEGSWLARYIAAAAPLDPVAREALLAADETLAAQHAEAVQEGQSAVVDDTWQHFVCFTCVAGRLWELDGRKGGPIDHGACDKAGVLAASVGVMKFYMARNPESLRFNLCVLRARAPLLRCAPQRLPSHATRACAHSHRAPHSLQHGAGAPAPRRRLGRAARRAVHLWQS